MNKSIGRGLLLATMVLNLTIVGDAAAENRNPPYWASFAAGKARMRTGPGRNFPAIWLYQRRDLPVRVIEVYPNWRKIEDPEGVRGWVQSNLLSEKRTGMVRGGVVAMRAEPDASAKLLWRAEAGVIGYISKCQYGWCQFDVGGKTGFVERGALWGVSPGEAVN